MDYEKERNLDPAQGEQTWDVTPERDNRALGNRIISSSENSSENANFENLGQILPTEPELEIPNTLTPPTAQAAKTAFDYQSIREEKGSDHISKNAIAEIDWLEQKLNQDGNIADFYESARDLTGAYLDNSFDRKLGETK